MNIRLVLGSTREYQFIESMNLSSFKKMPEVIREYLQFYKICGVFVGYLTIYLVINCPSLFVNLPVTIIIKSISTHIPKPPIVIICKKPVPDLPT